LILRHDEVRIAERMINWTSMFSCAEMSLYAARGDRLLADCPRIRSAIKDEILGNKISNTKAVSRCFTMTPCYLAEGFIMTT